MILLIYCSRKRNAVCQWLNKSGVYHLVDRHLGDTTLGLDSRERIALGVQAAPNYLL